MTANKTEYHSGSLHVNDNLPSIWILESKKWSCTLWLFTVKGFSTWRMSWLCPYSPRLCGLSFPLIPVAMFLHSILESPSNAHWIHCG